jgi:hypothetical protein
MKKNSYSQLELISKMLPELNRTLSQLQGEASKIINKIPDQENKDFIKSKLDQIKHAIGGGDVAKIMEISREMENIKTKYNGEKD